MSILAKRQHKNSVLIGSSHHLSKKLGISYHTFRKVIRYGQSKNLIYKTPDGYMVPKYQDLIFLLGFDKKNQRGFKLPKKGSFDQLQFKIYYSIVNANFNQQEYQYNKNRNIINIQRKAETEKGRISKSEMKVWQKYRSTRVQANSSIVTGRFHLSNLLNLSPAYCASLLKIWEKMKLIRTRKVFSSDFGDIYKFSERIIFINDIKMVCLGTKVTYRHNVK